MKFRACAIGAIVSGLSSITMSQAAELTVLASQGNLPGLTALAAAFAQGERAQGDGHPGSGRGAGAQAHQRPGDLLTANPEPSMEGSSRRAGSSPAP